MGMTQALTFGGLMAAMGVAMVTLNLLAPTVATWILPLPTLLAGRRHGLATGLTAALAATLVAALLYGWLTALGVGLPLWFGGALVGAAIRRGWRAEGVALLYGLVTAVVLKLWVGAVAWMLSGFTTTGLSTFYGGLLRQVQGLYAWAGAYGDWALRLLDHGWVLTAGHLLAMACLWYYGLAWAANRLPVRLPLPGSYRRVRRTGAWWLALLTGAAAATLVPRGWAAYPLAVLLPWAAMYPLGLHGLGAFERRPPARYRWLVALPWWPYVAFPILVAEPFWFLSDALAELTAPRRNAGPSL